MKVKTYIWGLLPALALISCIEDPAQAPRTEGEGEVEVTFNLTLPEASPASRALGETTDEYEVRQVDFVLLDTSLNPFENIKVDAGDITGTGKNRTFTIKVPVGTYYLMPLVNARDILAAAIAAAGGKLTRSAIDEYSIANMPTGGKWIANASTTGYRPFPMSGLTLTIITRETKTLTISMSRIMARADVVVPSSVANFKLTSVDVYNYNASGRLYTPTAPDVPSSTIPTMGPISYSGTEIDATGNRCYAGIYLFEAENHSGGHTIPKGLTARTCLVMGGIYDANANGNFTDDGPATYYRMDFSTGNGTSQTYLDVLRNHKYTFNVTKVSGRGAGDSQTAFETEPHNIEVEVVPWNQVAVSDTEVGEYYFTMTGDRADFSHKKFEAKTFTIKTNIHDFTMSLGGTVLMTGGKTNIYSSPNYLYELVPNGTDTYTFYIETLNPNVEEHEDRAETWSIVADRFNPTFTVTQQWAGWGGHADILYFDASNVLQIGRFRNDNGTPGSVTMDNIAYFTFGSVVGFKHTSGGGFALSDIVFNPTKLVVGTDITHYSYNNNLPGIPGYEVADKAVLNVSLSAYHNGANIRIGKGDPCKLVGLNITYLNSYTTEATKIAYLNTVNSGWRTPTARENVNFAGGAPNYPNWINWVVGVSLFTYTPGVANSGTVWNYWNHDGAHAGTMTDPYTVSVPVVTDPFNKAFTQILPAMRTLSQLNTPTGVVVESTSPGAKFWSSAPSFENIDNRAISFSGSSTYLVPPQTSELAGSGYYVRCVRPADVGLPQ